MARFTKSERQKIGAATAITLENMDRFGVYAKLTKKQRQQVIDAYRILYDKNGPDVGDSVWDEMQFLLLYHGLALPYGPVIPDEIEAWLNKGIPPKSVEPPQGAHLK